MPTGSLLDALILIATGVGATLAWFQRHDWIYPILQRFGKWFVNHLPGRQTQLRLMRIIDQLQPNGGSSLFDMVAAIETDVATVLDRLAVIEVKGNILEHGLEVATFTADRNGDCVYASQAYRDLVGLDADDMAGTGWKNSIDPDDLERWFRLWSQAVRDQRDFYCETSVVNVRTGKRTRVKVTAYVVRSRGQLVSYVGTVEPIDREPIRDRVLPRGGFPR